MALLIIGALMIAGGIGLLWARGRTEDQLLEVRSTQLSTAGDLVDLHGTIFDQVGAGGFSQLSEVNGTVVAEQPLRSELGEIDCVWFTARVEERYEERYTESDQNGTTRERTRTANETVSSTSRAVPFIVDDGTGRIEVDPEEATIEGEVVVDRHEPYDDRSDEIRLGSFSFRPSTGRRILGYTYHERAIPVGAKVYVIGDACDRVEGRLCIRKPNEPEKPFLVSVRSEEEIVAGMQKSATLKKWIALGLMILGGVALVWGIVNL